MRIWYKKEYTEKNEDERQECVARWSTLLDNAAGDARVSDAAKGRALERAVEPMVRTPLFSQ